MVLREAISAIHVSMSDACFAVATFLLTWVLPSYMELISRNELWQSLYVSFVRSYKLSAGPSLMLARCFDGTPGVLETMIERKGGSSWKILW